jgi:predicted RNase H-like HicB family nuclease
MSTSFAVVIEQAGTNLSAYVPALPGCIATAATKTELLQEIREAIRFHLDSLSEDQASHLPSQTSIEMVSL